MGRFRGQMGPPPEFPIHCLGVTKHGHPRHPLYLRGDLEPEPLR